MASEADIVKCETRIQPATGDFFCPVCRTKVIGRDHKIDCQQIVAFKKELEKRGHQIIVMA